MLQEKLSVLMMCTASASFSLVKWFYWCNVMMSFIYSWIYQTLRLGLGKLLLTCVLIFEMSKEGILAFDHDGTDLPKVEFKHKPSDDTNREVQFQMFLTGTQISICTLKGHNQPRPWHPSTQEQSCVTLVENGHTLSNLLTGSHSRMDEQSKSESSD